MKKAPTTSVHVITLVTADWYGSDSQLAYFSNKDYRNHETVLTEATRTKLGTRRL